MIKISRGSIIIFTVVGIIAVLAIGLDVRKLYIEKATQAQYIQEHMLETQALHEQITAKK